MGHRQGRHDTDRGDTGRLRERGLENARREASLLADYLQSGPPPGHEDSGRPPRLIGADWEMPRGTLSVYAIGRAMVLRGLFTEADLIALRRAFTGQLVTLDGEDGPQHTLIVWPPDSEDGRAGDVLEPGRW